MFFQLITAARLEKEGFAEIIRSKKQRCLIEERIVILTKAVEGDKAGENLRSQFPIKNDFLKEFPADIQNEAGFVACIAHRDQLWEEVANEAMAQELMTKLGWSIGAAEDKANKIAAALLLYPNGRAEWAAAKALRSVMKLTVNSAEGIKQQLVSAELAVTGRDSSWEAFGLCVGSLHASLAETFAPSMQTDTDKINMWVSALADEFMTKVISRCFQGCVLKCTPPSHPPCPAVP
jgi:hypothetical protein